MSDDPHSPFVSRVAQRGLTARFAVLVDADGRVLDAHVATPSGREPEHLILDGALVEALRRFHFLPAYGAGRAQRGWSSVECALRLGPAGVCSTAPGTMAARSLAGTGLAGWGLRSGSEDRESL